jgi:hypothetical protein
MPKILASLGVLAIAAGAGLCAESQESALPSRSAVSEKAQPKRAGRHFRASKNPLHWLHRAGTGEVAFAEWFSAIGIPASPEASLRSSGNGARARSAEPAAGILEVRDIHAATIAADTSALASFASCQD